MPTGCQRRNEALERARGNDQHSDYPQDHYSWNLGAPKRFLILMYIYIYIHNIYIHIIYIYIIYNRIEFHTVLSTFLYKKLVYCIYI